MMLKEAETPRLLTQFRMGANVGFVHPIMMQQGAELQLSQVSGERRALTRVAL